MAIWQEINRNMKDNILLSICIPTYNQPQKVRRLLESLFPQITPEVEIIIRDDSSNFETENIVKECLSKISIKCKYFKKEKSGLDNVIIFLTKEATGEYVWWLGDDVLSEGAVKKVLDIIKQYPDIAFVYVNSRCIDGKQSASELGEDKFFKDRNQVLEEIADLLGYISATIFKREKAVSGIELSKKHIGSAWVNLYLILYVLSGDGRFYYISEPYVLGDAKLPDKPTWYDGFQVFAVNFFYIVQEFKGKFAQRSIKRALSDNFRGIWKGIFVYRAMGYTTGLGSRTPKLPILAKLYWNFFEFWLALPFLLTPRFMARPLYKIYKLFFKRK